MAAPTAVQLDLSRQSLAAELSELARASGIDLLFDPALVARRKGVPIHGRFTAEEALARLLKGSGLAYRRTAEGAFTIVPSSSGRLDAEAPKTEQQAIPVSVSEILVTAHHSLDADIRRSPDDIQP